MTPISTTTTITMVFWPAFVVIFVNFAIVVVDVACCRHVDATDVRFSAA
jgi:hypothetical protein